jgi:hypothetical protein
MIENKRSDMDTTAYLIESLKAIDDAEIPGDLRAIAFECAFRHLTSNAEGGAALLRAAGDRGEVPIPTQDGDDVGLIGARLGLTSDLIHDVFDFSEDEPTIVIPASKLDREKAAASKQLALLVTAARQAAGREDWTRAGVIRDVCRDYGKLDSANFATTLLSMGSVFNFRGKGQQREVKLNRHGFERAAELIREFTE